MEIISIPASPESQPFGAPVSHFTVGTLRPKLCVNTQIFFLFLSLLPSAFVTSLGDKVNWNVPHSALPGTEREVGEFKVARGDLRINGRLMNVWGDLISLTGSSSAAFILFTYQYGLNAAGFMLLQNTNGTRRKLTAVFPSRQAFLQNINGNYLSQTSSQQQVERRCHV